MLAWTRAFRRTDAWSVIWVFILTRVVYLAAGITTSLLRIADPTRPVLGLATVVAAALPTMRRSGMAGFTLTWLLGAIVVRAVTTSVSRSATTTSTIPVQA